MYVSITGNGSETVKNLPCGEYTVEQVGGWSWRYSDSSVTVDIKSGENSVTFEKAAQNRNWLNGNSKKIQNRKGVSPVKRESTEYLLLPRLSPLRPRGCDLCLHV